MAWDGMGWHGMGWDGMAWDGMAWDGMDGWMDGWREGGMDGCICIHMLYVYRSNTHVMSMDTSMHGQIKKAYMHDGIAVAPKTHAVPLHTQLKTRKQKIHNLP